MTDFLNGYWDYVQEMWMADVVGTVFAVFLVVIAVTVVGVCLYVAVLIILWVDGKIEWYSDRKQCAHCQGWTLQVSDGQFDGCPAGQVCCEKCSHRHEMDSEVKLNCPVGGEVLSKTSVNGRLIIDVCPNGHGVWLTQDELDALADTAYDNGQMTGLAIGIAT